MTVHSKTIRLRRLILAQAVRTLSDAELRVMMHLLLGTCPETGRVWTSMMRLAEDLVPSTTDPAIAKSNMEKTVRRVVTHGFMSPWCIRGALHCYEVGPLFVRDENPPRNVPVEQDP